MKNTFKIAVIISVAIHAAIIIGVYWWQAFTSTGLGGGGAGLVEVSLALPLKEVGQEKNHAPKSTFAKINSQDGADNNGGAEGGGVGSGKGEGDPILITIWKKINMSKYYPETARREGSEGIPKVGFSISQDGRPQDVKIIESCGNDVLDKAAVETVRRSEPLPFYPKPITIAVKYSLK